MIDVWSDGARAGVLDRWERSGSAFAYDPRIAPVRAVSVTMPVGVPSWETSSGVLPIFEMNLPEGVLRETLRARFAKAAGWFDDIDLLALVGRSQLGRLRYSGAGEALDADVPFQSVDEILAHRRNDGLFAYLIDRFARYSGISGVQPKVLLRDDDAFKASSATRLRSSESLRSATHIVKLWERTEFPHLAANEFACLRAAERSGLEVPPFAISEDGAALVVERFDLRDDGTYRGLEDFCVLNGRAVREKYRGSYETAIVRRFTQFGASSELREDLERLFALIVLNCAVRNGDAHLKNFAIVYDDVRRDARLAPVFDVVTTTAYLPEDQMALTLDGRTTWPQRAQLLNLATGCMQISVARAREIVERVRTAVVETLPDLHERASDLPGFAPVATRMAEAWSLGVRSLTAS